MNEAESILQFWFGDDPGAAGVADVAARARLWFAPDPAFDDRIRDRFAAFPDRALAGEFSHWSETARATLALVLVLDQFPRNLYRGEARCFAYDATALDVARTAIARELDGQLHPLEAVFLYLPLEHAEDRAAQEQCLVLFRRLVSRAPAPLADQFESFVAYAERHRAVIERFGRFPHRNEVLARPSTPEEIRYLQSGGETFSAGSA